MFDANKPQKFELTSELAAIEQQLRGLTASPLRIDRDQLMFQAGLAVARVDHEREIAATQRVAGLPRWFWPSASALMTAACLLLSAMLVGREEPDSSVAQLGIRHDHIAISTNGKAPPIAREIELVTTPDIATTWPVRPAAGYLEQRYIALTRGVGELGADDADASYAPSNPHPSTARELLRELAPPHAARGPSS